MHTKQHLISSLSFALGVGLALVFCFSLFNISQAQICAEVYTPVCGANGTTYSNSCLATNAGITVASQGVCAAGITITSPNGGETLQIGQPHTITWKSSGFSSSDNVSIDLNDTSISCAPGLQGCWTSFGITDTQNTGSYTWDVSQRLFGPAGPHSLSIPTGHTFKIRLTVKSMAKLSSSASTMSRETFTLVAGNQQICTEDYTPVCGADGKTYSNSCVAANAGTTVASQGACTGGASRVCGDGTQCATDKICKATGGVCPEGARCFIQRYACVSPTTLREQICTNGSVCSIGNKCVAVTPRCLVAEGCPETTYQCKPTTTICTKEYDPVCGVNGKTYGNECTARASGVSVAEKGECNKNVLTTDDLKKKLIQQFGTPYVCGSVDTESKSLGRIVLTPSGDAYNFRISAFKGVLGWLNKVRVVRGLITKKAVVTIKNDSQISSFCSIKKTEPKICTKEYDPVCGVDKKTYGNTCEAEQKNAKVDYKGICKKVIGGDLDNNGCLVAAGYSWCASKNKCLRTFEEKCESTQVQICTDDYAPVCGANGTTYSNSCRATSAGSTIAHQGECTTGGASGTNTRTCSNGSVCGEGLVCKTNTDVQPANCSLGAKCFTEGLYSCVSASLPAASICGNGSVCAPNQTCLRDTVRLHCEKSQLNCNVRYRCQNKSVDSTRF